MFINRILALLLGLAARASACSVRYVSATTGDDANSGCLPTAPLLTLAACIDAVGSDGVCYVFPGRYREASAPAGKHVESVRNLTIARAPAALTTLLFNVHFHPREDATHACRAVDDARVLAQLVGESRHRDHHLWPRRARRKDWDVPWWLTLSWMQATGLVWDCKYTHV